MAVHGAKHRIGNVLKRKVDVFENPVVVPDLGHQFIGDLVRIAIKQADPRDLGLLGDLLQKFGQAIGTVKVFAVARDILRNDIEFLNADSREILGLGNKILDRTAPVTAADKRNGTVRATVVTPFCHLEVREKFRRGQHTVAAQFHGVFILKRGVFWQRRIGQACRHRFHSPDNIVYTSNAQNSVYLRHFSKHFLAVTLGQTAGDNDALEAFMFLQPGDIQNVVHRLFFGRLNKGAGVDDDNIRFGLIRCDLMPCRQQFVKHHFGIELVFGATKRNKSDFHVRSVMGRPRGGYPFLPF